MNDLTTTQNSNAAKPTTPPLTPDLTLLLDDPGSPDAAAWAIAATPALIGEARAVLPALQHVATAKAGERGVRAVIERRFQTYPQPVRSPIEWAAWWADYVDVLADVSLASLEAAMRAYVARPDSEFMPKPGKLLDLSTTTPCRSLQRYYRAKRAIQFADEAAAPKLEGDRVAPAEMKAMLSEFGSKTVAGPRKVELPSIAGVPDAGGITKEMRALQARQQGFGG